MKTADFSIRIEGTTPLLLNRFTDEAQIKATEGTSGALTGSKGSPREQAEPRLYLDEKKQLCIPQPNLFRCIIDAGKYFKAGKTKVTTARSSLIPACVDLHGVTLPLLHKEPWMVDTRPVRNPMTGGRFLCHRPMFTDWAIEFDITLETTMMSPKLLREIIDAAGSRIGLGDFRPDRKGPFGKFVVTRWSEDGSLAEAAE